MRFDNRALLIGLVGPAGSGKSTAASMLQDEWSFTDLAFADPILDMICALFANAGVDGSWATERSLKESPTMLGFSYRHLAQTLGTEWGRSLSPDFWLRVMAMRLECPEIIDEHVVISDVRFPNEAEFIKRRGGVLVRINRHQPDRPVRDHVSESLGQSLLVDYEINNNGSKATLASQIDRLVDALLAKRYAQIAASHP